MSDREVLSNDNPADTGRFLAALEDLTTDEVETALQATAFPKREEISIPLEIDGSVAVVTLARCLADGGFALQSKPGRPLRIVRLAALFPELDGA